jgi:DnaJ-class molecular chaperone
MEKDGPRLKERARAALARLLARLRPEAACLRCAGTGASQGGLDCPDCGGTGRR